MGSKQVLELIAAAHRYRATKLDLSGQNLTELPDSIEELDLLVELDLRNLINLKRLYINSCQLEYLPISVSNLSKLSQLYLAQNKLTSLPEEIGNLTRLNKLYVSNNQLKTLPESIGQLSRLKYLDLSENQISELPQSLKGLTNLLNLRIDGNPIEDLSILQTLPKLKNINFLGVTLNRRYWTKLSEWKSEFILDEKTYKVRCFLLDRFGVDRILADLSAVTTPFNLNFGRCLPIGSLKRIVELKNLTGLTIAGNDLTIIPDEIQNATNLKFLDISKNKISLLPDNSCNLVKLQELSIQANQISELPEKFGNLVELRYLNLSDNCLRKLPDSIGQFQDIEILFLGGNHLTELPDSIGKCQQIKSMDLGNNNLRKIPETFRSLVNLKYINLHLNPIEDLSPLQNLPVLEKVWILSLDLPCRYWIKFNNWKAEWLLNENNAEIRRTLIEQVGYEKICDELGAIAIDSWQEYTLLKIDKIEIVYQGLRREMSREPMMLLKMTCPSTSHIHILRVPPDMTRAEDAIVWVNHGIHPSKFAIQT